MMEPSKISHLRKRARGATGDLSGTMPPSGGNGGPGGDMEAKLAELKGRVDTLMWGIGLLVAIATAMMTYQLNSIGTSIKDLRTEMKQEMDKDRALFKQELKDQRAEFKQDLKDLKADLIQEIRSRK